MAFSFNLFDIFLQIFRATPSPSPELLRFNQDTPSKNQVFLMKSLQSHSCENAIGTNGIVIKLWSHDQIYNRI